MATAFKRVRRSYVAELEIDDDYFREYTVDGSESGGLYINPRRVTVSVNPDTAQCRVTLRGPMTRVRVRIDASHTETFRDYLDALQGSSTTSLVRDAVRAMVASTGDLAGLFDVSNYLDEE